jgi:hypothetical protein
MKYFATSMIHTEVSINSRLIGEFMEIYVNDSTENNGLTPRQKILPYYKKNQRDDNVFLILLVNGHQIIPSYK